MMNYTKDNPLRVGTLFSGYDSQCLALERMKKTFPGFDYRIAFWCEIEKNAIEAHNILFPEAKDLNIGDITTVDWTRVAPCDLMTYSSPCQDWSNAGKQAGGAEGSGTRSSLLWECRRAIIALKPKYLLLENVAALVSDKFRPHFLRWQHELEGYGYRNYAGVLNSKDYGVPQNRERIFLVSIRDDGDEQQFYFPEPFELKKRLRDVLETEVDDKYYLSADRLDGLAKSTIEEALKGRGFRVQSEKQG